MGVVTSFSDLSSSPKRGLFDLDDFSKWKMSAKVIALAALEAKPYIYLKRIDRQSFVYRNKNHRRWLLGLRV